MKQRTIIFDIDGTLADIEHRRHFVQCDKPDWKLFNAAMVDDTPNKPIMEMYQKFPNYYEMILVTGRTEEYRIITEEWLEHKEIEYDELHMRPDGDYRPDHIIKEEILRKLQTDGKDILFAVDDRQQVVDMWRRNGITCLQCAEGKF